MKYFVSYFFTLMDGKQGWGNTCVKRDRVIDSPDEWKSIENLLETKNDMSSVTIMYWRRVEDSE